MYIDVTKPELYQARNGAKCIGIIKNEGKARYNYVAVFEHISEYYSYKTVSITCEGFRNNFLSLNDWDLVLIPQVTLVFEDWLAEQGVSTYRFYMLVKNSKVTAWKEYKHMTKEDYVDEGFRWGETKEGYSYWNKLYVSWLSKLASHNGPVVLGFDKKPKKGK